MRPMPAEATADTSLRGALDALSHERGDIRTLATKLVALQQDLIAGQGGRLLGLSDAGAVLLSPKGTPEQADMLLAKRARDTGALSAEPHDQGVRLACPLGLTATLSDGQNVDLIAVHGLAKATPLALALAQERLDLSAALARALAAAPSAAPAVDALDGADRALAEALTLPDGLFAAASHLATSLSASRVVLGALRGGKVIAFADSRAPQPSQELRQRLALALGETADVGGRLDLNGPAPGGVARAFDGPVLGRASLSAQGSGVVVLAEGTQDAAQVETAAAHFSLALLGRLRPHGVRGWLEPKLAHWPVTRSWAAETRWRNAKRAALGAVLLLLLLPVPRGVDAPVTIEALERRLVTAPIAGRIDQVAVQPGDAVKAGESLLVQLDTQPLQAERDQASAALQAALAQAATARADGDPDGERTAALRAEQAQAQMSLLDYRIAEASVRAPLSGTVMGEDLRRRTGAQVARGDTLFEVAVDGAYRAELLVSDRDVARVSTGDRVSLGLSAFSLRRYSATVDRVYPLAEVKDGRNAFRVIATLEPGADGLKPGMAGRGSIRTGWQPLGWRVLEPVVQVVRRALWV
jgi:multidrug efflux pump subunit AcrA (membrane-fusion protein)